jgi:hypothetical protein
VINTLLGIADQIEVDDDADDDHGLYVFGADRAAARSFPLLLLPEAADLRRLVGPDAEEAERRLSDAALRLARSPSPETRLYLARGLDPLWDSPCRLDGACHHRVGMRLAIEPMRDSLFGEWTNSGRRRTRLPDPVDETLDAAAAVAIHPNRLE